ncbi:hypothetical protein KHA96_15325 [Bacillus sp. FJAT-49711]|uniref:hypothetical protein n=1 Tax=Bacillus sp. FJAT-49711 TaxID=2833585 RepID=UPI001BC9E693|nr:hypothetical protein [Bacillus sp. FJAT-49711]MBS4219684.1 hypothetical protein [Bacillus sp. FJAT-49711]
MFKYWLFLHFAGISIWVGSLLTVTILLFIVKKHLGSKELSTIVKKMTKVVNTLIHPSAFFVLLSGIFMMIAMNFGDSPKPFYLEFMERIGGMTVLFTIIAVSIFGRKVVKKFNTLEKEGSLIAHPASINTYITMMLISVLLVLTVIFVVSFKF